MVDVHLKGGKPSVAEGMRDAGKNFAAIAFLALISTIVNMLTRAIRKRGRGGAAIVGAIIASIIETVWTVLTFLLLPAIIIEDLSLGAALRRTRDIYKRNLLVVGIGEVGVRFVTGLISVLAIWLIVGVTYLSIKITGTGTAGVLIAIVLFGTLLSLLAAFNTFVRMSYYTCMFLWAVEVERVGQTARAPLPLAIALKQIPAPA
jgi:hypothetical protein